MEPMARSVSSDRSLIFPAGTSPTEAGPTPADEHAVTPAPAVLPIALKKRRRDE